MGDVEILQRFGNDLPHPHARVERGIRVLKHHLHLAPVGPHLLLAQGGYLGAAQPDLSGGGLLQPQNGFTHRGFAAARFAHQTQGFTGLDVKGHAVHRPHMACHALQQAAAYRKVLFEAGDPKNFSHGQHSGSR